MTKSAEELTAERGAVYGHPLGDFVCAQDMYDAWSKRTFDSGKYSYTDDRLKAHRHGIHMILIKLARLAVTPYHADSLDDIAGYVQCLRMCAPEKPKPTPGFDALTRKFQKKWDDPLMEHTPMPLTSDGE